MNDAALLENIAALTTSWSTYKKRVNALEDLGDLQSAIAGNAKSPLIPWEQAKGPFGPR
jgi:hypothetical protein